MRKFPNVFYLCCYILRIKDKFQHSSYFASKQFAIFSKNPLIICILRQQLKIKRLSQTTSAVTSCKKMSVQFAFGSIRFFISSLRTLDVPWTFLGRSLDVPWTFLGRSLDVPWTFLGRSLDVLWTFLGRSLDVPCTFF